MGERDLTTGSIPRLMVSLALPLFLSLSLQSAYALTDLYFVGLLGGASLAGLGISLNMVFLTFALGQMLGSGALAMMSQAFGRKEPKVVQQIFAQTLIVTAGIGVFFVILGYLGAGVYFSLFTTDAGVVAEGTTYFRIFSLTFIIQLLLMVCGFGFRAVGNFIVPMFTMMGSSLLNVILDPLLIFGLGPIPAMGIAGAAWATVISQGAVLLVYLYLIFFHPKNTTLTMRGGVEMDWKLQWKLLKIGIPAGLQYSLFTLGMVIAFAFLKPYGGEVAAAVGTVFRIVFSGMLPGVSVASALAAMVGQNYGARKFDRVKSAIIWGFSMNSVLFSGIYLFLLFWPEFFMGLFTDEPNIIAQGSVFLQINGLLLPLYLVGMNVSFISQGLGRTFGPFLGVLTRVGSHFGILVILSAFGLLTLNGIYWSGTFAVMIENIVHMVVLTLFWRVILKDDPTPRKEPFPLKEPAGESV